MGGRRKSILIKHFKPILSDSKVPKIRCIFCLDQLSKNGTRMMQHLKKCKKAPETVTVSLSEANKGKQKDDTKMVDVEEVSQHKTPKNTSVKGKMSNFVDATSKKENVSIK